MIISLTSMVRMRVLNGPEQQVRGSVGIGDEAADLDTEQGYLTLEVFEIDGVLKGPRSFSLREDE